MILSHLKVSLGAETWKQPLTDFCLLLSNESQIVSSPPFPCEGLGDGNGESMMSFLP